MSESSPDLEILADPNRIVYVVGSCNGIVCYYDSTSTIVLCNPATREFKQLPPTSLQLGVTDYWGKHYGVGFGFDSSNIYDFKVLRVFCAVGTHNDEIRAEVFTLSSNNWRQLDWDLNNKLIFLYGKGLFCANSFNFIMRYRKRYYAEEMISCWDIRTERFKTMNFPPKAKDDNGSFQFLMAFKGCLSSVYIYPLMFMNCEEKPIEIWMMKDYGVADSWTKLYTIGPRSAIPLSFYMDEDDLLLVQLKTHKLVSCHLNTLVVRSIKIRGYPFYSQVIVYKETLVSIM